jgi:tetratricopeptide (TPR) repeat protein
MGGSSGSWSSQVNARTVSRERVRRLCATASVLLTVWLTSPPVSSLQDTAASQPLSDLQAFDAANRISDPVKKIAALEAFLRDFPESGRRGAAHEALFETLVKIRPTERDRIIAHAEAVIDATPDGFRGPVYNRLASRLLEERILLDVGEDFARTGLEVFEADERARVQRTRAAHLLTIGRVQLEQGRIAAAEETLREAYAANPEIPPAAVALADLAERRGDDARAVDYWMTAALTGRLSKVERDRFESVYRRVHGSIDSLDAALDQKYRARFPPAVQAEAYSSSPLRSKRLVLAEVFTSAGCPPCVSADLAADGALDRYSRNDVAIIMHHLHVPVPDPMTNRSTEARAALYRIAGLPTFVIDGVVEPSGGGGRDRVRAVYARLVALIDKALEQPADASLAIEASIEGGTVRVRANVSGLKSDHRPARLQIVLVEDMLRYSGENGIRFHPMVVRSVIEAGLALHRGAPSAVDHAFNLAAIADDNRGYLDGYEVNGQHDRMTFSKKLAAMDQRNLSVVAFVQEDQTKRVLQAASVKLAPAKGGAVVSR